MGPLFKVKQQLSQIIDLILFTVVKSRDGIIKLNQQNNLQIDFHWQADLINPRQIVSKKCAGLKHQPYPTI